MNKQNNNVNVFVKKVVAFATSFAFVASAVGVSVAIAAITFSGTSITGDSSFTTFTGAASTTFDMGSGNTLSLQKTNNGPIQTGTGAFTLNGNLILNGAFSPSSTLTIGVGGTGIATAPITLGQLLMASGTTWTIGGLVAGSNITITTSTPGQITIASTFTTTTINGLSNTAYTFNGSNALSIATSSPGTVNFTNTSTFATSTSFGVTALTITSSSPTWTFNFPQQLNLIAQQATSTGNLLVASSTGWTALTVGTTGNCLVASSTAPLGMSWQVCSSSPGTAGGSNTQMQYNNAGTVAGASTLLFTSSTNFFNLATGTLSIATTTNTGLFEVATSTGIGLYITNAATPQVGIGTVSPTNPLTVSGNANITGAFTVGTTTVNAGSFTVSSTAAGTAITSHISATSSISFGTIATSTCVSTSTTATGAAAGDSVYASPTPVTNGAETTTTVWMAYSSSTNTVGLRMCNIGTVNNVVLPAETWRVDVWKH